MTLQFKKTADDVRKLDKSFTALGNAVTANATQNCSIIHPVWLLAYSANYETATHVSCSEFGRTYFINDIVMSTGGKCFVYATVDVLTTYASNIKACSGTVIRSESVGAPTMIPDGKLPIFTNERIIDCDNFPSTPFSRTVVNPYILTTIGGAPSSQGGS